MTQLLSVPDVLTGPDIGQAVELVQRYYDTGRAWPHFTGAFFERLDGGGDRAGVRNRITGADIVAVSMLSIDLHQRTAEELESQSDRISRLLADIPWGLDLVDADDQHLDDSSPAAAAFELLKTVHGIDWVTANKLLARKRPRLLPVYDNVVREVLGHPDRFWIPLRDTLRADDRALYRRLLAIREAAAVGDEVSPLRIFDVVCWREGKDRGVGDDQH